MLFYFNQFLTPVLSPSQYSLSSASTSSRKILWVSNTEYWQPLINCRLKAPNQSLAIGPYNMKLIYWTTIKSHISYCFLIHGQLHLVDLFETSSSYPVMSPFNSENITHELVVLIFIFFISVGYTHKKYPMCLTFLHKPMRTFNKLIDVVTSTANHLLLYLIHSHKSWFKFSHRIFNVQYNNTLSLSIWQFSHL